MPKYKRGKKKANNERPSSIPFYKGMGQHILKNPAILDQMVHKSAIRPSDTVLEIGPGTGNLTVRLLQKAKKVICIEKDYRMVVELRKRVAGTPNEYKLKIIHDDVLKIPFPFFNVCVANIPYSISSKITFKLIRHRPLCRCALLMYQKEFGEKMCSKPGEKGYCRLACNTQLLARVDHMMKVGRNNFRPPPKVDSVIIRIEPINPPPPVKFEEWDGLSRILFTRKNKKIRSNFKSKKLVRLLFENYLTYCSVNNVKVDMNFSESDMKQLVFEVLEKSELGDIRAAKMKHIEVLKLLAEFNSNNIHFS